MSHWRPQKNAQSLSLLLPLNVVRNVLYLCLENENVMLHKNPKVTTSKEIVLNWIYLCQFVSCSFMIHTIAIVVVNIDFVVVFVVVFLHLFLYCVCHRIRLKSVCVTLITCQICVKFDEYHFWFEICLCFFLAIIRSFAKSKTVESYRIVSNNAHRMRSNVKCGFSFAEYIKAFEVICTHSMTMVRSSVVLCWAESMLTHATEN